MPRSHRTAPRSLATAAALVALSCTTGCPHNGGAAAPRAAGDASNGHELPSAQRVQIHTADGWTLVGDLWPAGGEHLSDIGTYVVLVHQLASNRREWDPFIARVRATHPGWTLLAIDLRGHGESLRGPDGPTPWSRFDNDTARWAGLTNDVRAAAEYLRRLGTAPGVYIVGSSIGSTAAIRYAGDPLSGCDGVVLISPGLGYHGLATLPSFTTFAASNRAALLIASDGDADSAAAVRVLANGPGAHHPRIAAEVYPGTGAHGVSIGAPGVHPELWDRIIRAIDEWSHPTEPTGEPARPSATDGGDATNPSDASSTALDSATGGG